MPLLGVTSDGDEAAGGCQPVIGCATAPECGGGARRGTWSCAWVGGKREADAAALLAAARWRNCICGGRRWEEEKPAEEDIVEVAWEEAELGARSGM